MSNSILLSIIIPAYNEEAKIEGTLREVAEYVRANAIKHEVIVVDDGSTDLTGARAKDCATLFDTCIILTNTPNRGKGYAVKRGMLAAHGDYILFMDADNSTSIAEFNNFLPYLYGGSDVAIASRRMKESRVEESQPLVRILLGQLYIFFSRIILGVTVRDFNCGFKAYTKTAAQRLFAKGRMDDWSFDTEILFLATKYHCVISEIPVRWVHKSGSKVRPWRDGIRSFMSLVRIKVNDLKRRYET